MNGGRPEQRVRELVRELEPVRPIPRLRQVLALCLGVFAGVTGLHGLLGGPPPVAAHLWRDPAFVAVFAGLALTAGGALLAALAGAVPGRGRAAVLGRQTGLVGVVLALGAALLSLANAASGDPALSFQRHLGCAGRACALGIAPAGVAALFLWRASTRASLFGAAVAAAGAACLGALAVHLSCAASHPLHWLLGHSLGPVALALIAVLPVSAILARRTPP